MDQRIVDLFIEKPLLVVGYFLCFLGAVILILYLVKRIKLCKIIEGETNEDTAPQVRMFWLAIILLLSGIAIIIYIYCHDAQGKKSPESASPSTTQQILSNNTIGSINLTAGTSNTNTNTIGVNYGTVINNNTPTTTAVTQANDKQIIKPLSTSFALDNPMNIDEGAVNALIQQIERTTKLKHQANSGFVWILRFETKTTKKADASGIQSRYDIDGVIIQILVGGVKYEHRIVTNKPAYEYYHYDFDYGVPSADIEATVKPIVAEYIKNNKDDIAKKVSNRWKFIL